MPAVPIIAAVSGAATAIGAAAASTIGFATISSAAATAIGTGIIAGGMTAIQGGDVSDVLESAIVGGVTSYVGSAVSGAVGNVVAEATGSQVAGSIAGSAAGTLATGGDSEDVLTSGLLAGIGAGIDEARLAAADEYLSNIPVDGYDPATLPTELDVIAAFPELAPPPVFDTTFTPDYSLSTGAPIVPDMGAQGIQVPTITELVDVVNQPVDYSLPVPDSGFGLQMPEVPNLDTLGGGQGIIIKTTDGYVTEDGFIPNSYIASLGDPESFINKPVVDVPLSLTELQSTNESELSQKLAGLDIARTLTPYALAALTKEAYDLSKGEGTSGFAMVPIPEDWRSPEYNMAFTPSAPIDFGSVGMLAGTQFANPAAQPRQMDYSLSDVINTLNFQAVPFVQQQYEMPVQEFTVPDILQQFQSNPNVAMSDIIGQLDNAPASLNSIIAGIQSQYG